MPSNNLVYTCSMMYWMYALSVFTVQLTSAYDSKRLKRLIDYERYAPWKNEYAVQVHPKHHLHHSHHSHEQDSAAAATHDLVDLLEEQFYETDPLDLGTYINAANDFMPIERPGWNRKKAKERSSLKELLLWYGTSLLPRESITAQALADAQTQISGYDEECVGVCDPLHPNPDKVKSNKEDFRPWGECYATCFYVASGVMAKLAGHKYRHSDWRPGHPRFYKFYMHYLFGATHRDDRFTDIQDLYNTQREEARTGFQNWVPFPNQEPWQTVMNGIRPLFQDHNKNNILFVWRGLGGLVVPDSIGAQNDAGTILFGPQSTTVKNIDVAIKASKYYPNRGETKGSILRYEIPINPLGGTDQAVRGGKTVQQFSKTFGLLYIPGQGGNTGYANNMDHKRQEEVLLWDVPKSWIKVQWTYQR